MGVKQDLETFQEACRAAKVQIVDTDQDSADRQVAVLNTLEAGSTRQGSDGPPAGPAEPGRRRRE